MICKEVDEYIQLVRSLVRPVCEDQLLLCDVVEKAFRDERIRIDTEQLRRYLNNERFFPFRLFPWERFVFALHNCVYRDDGLLRWPELLLYCGRGTGKNGFISFEAFSWLTPVNGVKDFHVDIFANSEDQAKTSFDDVWNVMEGHADKLKKFFRWNREVIESRSTGSRLRYRTSGAKTKDGGRPGAVIFDEYHEYVDDKLIDVAETGLGKKPFPRKTIATTDGNIRGGPLDELKDRAGDILRRGMKDCGLLPFCCRVDSDAEIMDPKMWHKANPSLAYFPVLRQELEREFEKYKRSPSPTAAFKVKRMNSPSTIDVDSVTDWTKIQACSRPLPDLQWADCVAAVDYMKTTDFLSAGLLFKYNDVFCWMQHSWVCRASLDLPKVKAPLEDWEAAGYLTFVDGPEIPPDVPAAWLEEQGHEYNITALGLDNFRITLLAKALKEHGFDTDKGGANNIRLTKRVTQNRYVPLITSLFNTGRIIWGDDPMMAWYTWNTCVETDRGNQYYGKKDPERRKTDGFMALVSAICAADDLSDAAETADIADLTFISF